MLLALEFPPISHLVEWPAMFGRGEWYAFNKIALLSIAATLITLALFAIAGRQSRLVPTGVQNIIEGSVDFIREGIVLQMMGNAGLAWMPFFTALFFFIFFGNVFEIVPGIQMPITARLAIPLVLAVTVWLLFNSSGIKNQGLGGYFKNSLFPPGVPWPLYILLTPIEFISVFIVRPVSLAIRLFANLLAGHILLVTFAVLSVALFEAASPLVKLLTVLPFFMLVILTAFEIFVSLLQAYIFTLLAALYVGGAQHPEH